MELTKRINRFVNKHLKTLLQIWVIFFTIFTLYLWYQGHQTDNKLKQQTTINRSLIQRLAENQRAIQRSRRQSCIANINTVIHAFDPFIPKHDDPNTPRNEVQDFKTFTDSLIKKRNHCGQQVAIKPRRDK
jgi:hypothetical protein